MKAKESLLFMGLLIVLVSFPQISETIYMPALPSVAAGLQTTAYLVEATLAIYFLGFAFGVLCWGTVSDSLGRRWTLLIGLQLYTIATLRCAQVSNIETLLLWRFFQAFGASVGSVITQTILRDCYEGAERTKRFSLISGALAFSPAIGPLCGGLISEFLGWRANFWVLAALAVLLSLWAFFGLMETRPKHVKRLQLRELKDLVSTMLTSSRLWGHILLIAGTNGILFGFYQEAPFVFIDQLGMQPKAYGCFGLLIAAATVLAARISYRKSKDYSSKTLIDWGSMLVVVGGVMFTAFIGIDGLTLQFAQLILILILFLIFLGIGLIIPNSLSHALKPYQYAVGTAGSLFGGIYYCLIAACTWLMSVLHDGTALPLPLYMTILGLSLVLGCYLIKEPSGVYQYAKKV